MVEAASKGGRKVPIRHESWGLGALVGLWASGCDPSWWMDPDGEE